MEAKSKREKPVTTVASPPPHGRSAALEEAAVAAESEGLTVTRATRADTEVVTRAELPPHPPVPTVDLVPVPVEREPTLEGSESDDPWKARRFAPGKIQIIYDRPNGGSFIVSDEEARAIAMALDGDGDHERVLSRGRSGTWLRGARGRMQVVSDESHVALRIFAALGDELDREAESESVLSESDSLALAACKVLGDLDVIIFALTSGDDDRLRRALAGPIGIAARSTVERLQSGESQDVVDSTTPTTPTTEGGDA